MSDQPSLQTRLFELLKSQRPSGKLIAELMSLLAVSRASVYKRMKSEIQISARELEQIMDHFSISPSLLFSSNKNLVTMMIPEKAIEGDPIIHFLTPIRDQIRALAAQPNPNITFLAVSFPVFYSFLYPELALFKFYVYRNSVWRAEHAKIPPLAIASLARNKEYLNLFSEIRNIYGHINSTEVWTGNFFQSTIDELKFYLECELFTDPKEALLVLSQLEKTIENISTMVKAGNKSTMCRNPELEEGGTLDLYYNDSGHFGSTTITESDSTQLVYLTYDQPNYLVSADPVLIEDTKRWTSKVVKKSSPISKLGMLDQVKYFNSVREKLSWGREALERLVG